MKKSFFICLVLLIAMQVFSQNKPTIMSSGALPPVKLIERDVKDTAFITVFYKFACAPLTQLILDVEMKGKQFY